MPVDPVQRWRAYRYVCPIHMMYYFLKLTPKLTPLVGL